MINRQVFTGRNAAESPIVVAMELQLRDKQVELLVFPRESLPEDFYKLLQEKWEKGEEQEFPVEPERIIRSAEEEHLLPMEIRADKPELISRLRNEWTLKLLSYKLYENLGAEITNLQDKLDELGSYSQEFWDKAKSTWDQVSNHAQDFNLSRNHATELRERLNKQFERLKKLREGGQAEFEKTSTAVREQLETRISAFQEKLSDKAKANELFDQLKHLQREVKEARMTHRDRRSLWKVLDEAYAVLHKQKESAWQNHLSNRIQGLEEAMKKIQDSIDRDRSNIEFEVRKMQSGRIGQLEQQLRSTRVKVTEDRIRSKEEKLNDMAKTLQSLRKKEASQQRKKAAPPTESPASESSSNEAASAELPTASAPATSATAPAAPDPSPSEQVELNKQQEQGEDQSA